MPEAEFDRVAADYQAQHNASIRLSGEDSGYFAQYKAIDTRRIADAAGCLPQDILDFGSGIGNAVEPLSRNFPEARLTCLDVSSSSLDLSRRRWGGEATYRHYDGEQIPEDIGTFDLIFTACVFHHIPETQHVALLGQLKRSLRPGGLFVLFEHNPWNPLTRQAVKSCPFDQNAVLISAPKMRKRLEAAGFTDCNIRYRIFFPAALAWLRPLERFMTGVSLGAQYCLGAR